MYNLIIVDDERRTRSGLRSLIDWKDLGFEVVGDFKGGNDALQYISRNAVDVVLSDIKMNDISGLTVAEEIQKKYPAIMVVLLSGYREFDFAKEALKYNVKHYLLKPVKLDEILDVFKKLKHELDIQGKHHASEKALVPSEMEKLMPYFREQFFRDLIHGAIVSTEKADQLSAALQVPFRLEPFFLITVEVVDAKGWVYDHDELQRAVTNSFNLFCGHPEGTYTLHYARNLYVVFCEAIAFSADSKALPDLFVYAIVDLFEKELGTDIKVGVSSIHSGFIQVCEAYKEARIALDHSSDLDAEGKVSLYSRQSANMLQKVKDVQGEGESLYQLIIEGNLEAVEHMLKSTLTLWMGTHKNLSTVKNLSVYLVGHIVTKANRIMTDDNPFRYTDYSVIFSAVHAQEIAQHIYDSILAPLVSYFSRNKNKTEEIAFGKAMEYIEKNYMDEAMSLNVAAEMIYISPSYFSRIFKNRTGENFVNYITKLRMEKAKQLLACGVNISEVSEKIGYKSSKYFSRIFKQYTGKTPSDYKKGDIHVL